MGVQVPPKMHVHFGDQPLVSSAKAYKG